MEITFDNIKETYQQMIQEMIDGGVALTAGTTVELAAKLYKELKTNIVFEREEGDMLLFQYGIYDWMDGFGEHFEFDITRQFFIPNCDEPYQLNLTLNYDAEMFKGIRSYDCWSIEFSSIEDFVAHIQTTEGFQLAEGAVPKTYRLEFGAC